MNDGAVVKAGQRLVEGLGDDFYSEIDGIVSLDTDKRGSNTWLCCVLLLSVSVSCCCPFCPYQGSLYRRSRCKVIAEPLDQPLPGGDHGTVFYRVVELGEPAYRYSLTSPWVPSTRTILSRVAGSVVTVSIPSTSLNARERIRALMLEPKYPPPETVDM